ncbi:MAG TPA: hypothetical protein VFQ61_11990 [Polyangiaceae bacterium]|nr:hypothetical protein [Polyangiaceae bacterium]
MTLIGPPHPMADSDFSPDAQDSLFWASETIAVSRKKVLFRLLANQAAERLGLTPTAAEIQAESRRFRLKYGLAAPDNFRAWLARTALSLEQFSELMRDFVVVAQLERRYASEVDAGLNHQQAVYTAHRWAAEHAPSPPHAPPER